LIPIGYVKKEEGFLLVETIVSKDTRHDLIKYIMKRKLCKVSLSTGSPIALRFFGVCRKRKRNAKHA
jgi:hypothetical protein